MKREESRQEAYVNEVSAWDERQAKFWEGHRAAELKFKEEQAASHEKVDRLRLDISEGDPDAVIEQAAMVLENSDYDGLFEKSFDIDYKPDSKLLMLDYDLPGPSELPDVKSVQFVKATGELKETKISATQQKANFDSTIYQICLRTIHEIFESDVDRNIEKVLFNGSVNFIDPATGADSRSCIISVIVDREAFQQIDLARVEPKACFKSLKGVSAASLVKLTPIAPIMKFDKDDRRFVDGVDVTSAFGESTNLAAISWEDFEHLVRELFEKEFSGRGGEVKVTQASRDGGVDAIAFDPDPITGGKIVIQAKRYTRTVGVSAIRDLFGTVMNEGAAKGILVTTADYGPDAYKFASDKPLTLMNGSNLLHLLERHGVKAKIDIAEARALRD
jgi:restriction system protein